MENKEIEIIKKVFEYCGFNIKEVQTRKDEIDLIFFDFGAEKEGIEYAVEVKTSTSFNFMRVAHMLSLHCKDSSYKPVIVLLSVANDGIRKNCKDYGVDLIDISNLLYAIEKESNLYSELVSSLSFSIDPVTIGAHPLLKSAVIEHANRADSLIKELELISSGRPSFTKYEDWCFDALKYIFDDKLALWDRQGKSNKDLYRFDLLCRIKDDEKDTFWRMLENHFQSKYVIFEFKNYGEKITQAQIYTTEKYLYKKALRSVAFIIARNGFDENSRWAAKGSLRENGKLIILLDSNDVINMITMKKKDDNPSDYLLDKLDKLLSELEK